MNKTVRIKYINYKNDVSWRLITPEKLQFGISEWHKEPQWLLYAFDHDKNDLRTFAIKDIMAWVPRKEVGSDKDKHIEKLEIELSELRKIKEAFDRMVEGTVH